MDVDLIYLWVDGSDSQWLARKENTLQTTSNNISINNKGRFVSHDELKYSLRSVEKFLPWIRNIYIVTDNQQPEWLNLDNPRIKLIDHKEILPPKALPCFNSVVIEYFIYKIPGLSEHFLYANDDMFVNKALAPSFFFTEDGLPIVRLQRQKIQRLEYFVKQLLNKPINNYRLSIKNAIDLIQKKYNKYYSGVLHHNMDAFLRSDFQKLVEETFKDEISNIVANSFRSPSDIQRILIAYDSLAKNRAEIKYTKRSESLRLKAHKGSFDELLTRYKPALFCLNDTEHATDQNRAEIEPFLRRLFPKSSSFEK